MVPNEAYEEVPENVDLIAAQIVDAAFNVHSRFGPGLLESDYEACMAHELQKRGLKVERQKLLPIEYDGVRLDAGYRLDLLVQDVVIVELKAVDAFQQIHQAQVMTYL